MRGAVVGLGLSLLAMAAVSCSSASTPTTASPPDGSAPADAPPTGSDASTADEGSPPRDAAVDAAAAPPADAAPVDAAAYASASLWLCGANAAHDYCLDPQTATSLDVGGTQTAVPVTPAASPTLDCFYVYPSVDVTDPPGNVQDLTNLTDILDPVREQAAPLSQVCKVYAPLYHQATYASYLSADADTYLEIAYADVAAAFAEYLSTWNQGRDFVLVGHSQGSHMLRRLVQRQIEGNSALAQRLAVAILGGAFGDITVPKGQVVGGTFPSTPLCTTPTQRGCVITWNTFGQGFGPPAAWGTTSPVVPAGQDIACTNPASPGATGATPLTRAWLFTQFMNPDLDPPQSTGVTTPFGLVPSFYTGQCATSVAGFSYFEVAAAPAAGDTRHDPIDFANAYYAPSVVGLHLLDFGFPMQDLLTAVTSRQ